MAVKLRLCVQAGGENREIPQFVHSLVAQAPWTHLSTENHSPMHGYGVKKSFPDDY